MAVGAMQPGVPQANNSACDETHPSATQPARRSSMRSKMAQRLPRADGEQADAEQDGEATPGAEQSSTTIPEVS
jgi:hypothetical protein